MSTYETAKVLSILAQGVKIVQDEKNPYQKVQLQILDGSDKGKIITITYGGTVSIKASHEVTQGQTIVLMKSVVPNETPTYK